MLIKYLTRRPRSIPIIDWLLCCADSSFNGMHIKLTYFNCSINEMKIHPHYYCKNRWHDVKIWLYTFFHIAVKHGGRYVWPFRLLVLYKLNWKTKQFRTKNFNTHRVTIVFNERKLLSFSHYLAFYLYTRSAL